HRLLGLTRREVIVIEHSRFDTEDEELLAGQPAVEVLPVELVLRPAEFQPLLAMVGHPEIAVRLQQLGQVAPMPIQGLLDHRVARDARQRGPHRLLGRSPFLRLFARAHDGPPDRDPRQAVPATGFYRLAENPDSLRSGWFALGLRPRRTSSTYFS